MGQAIGIRLTRVERRFGAGHGQLAALREVTLEVAPGELVVILGPSGSGKSALIALIAGVDRPTSGDVCVAGMALELASGQDLADHLLKRVGLVTGLPTFVTNLSVEDNVALPMALAGEPPEERRSRARGLLKTLKLDARAGDQVGRLSRADQRRASIARAIANRPGLILADDPTEGLDEASRRDVVRILSELNRAGATVVIATADPRLAPRSARVVTISGGRALVDPPPRPTLYAPEALPPVRRLNRLDAARWAMGSLWRRAWRHGLSASTVALGVVGAIVTLALAAGVQRDVAGPTPASVELRQVVIQGSTAGTPLNEGSRSRLAHGPHVQRAWGRMLMTGSLSLGDQEDVKALSGVLLTSTGPRDLGFDPSLDLLAGRLPRSDDAAEVVLDQEMVMRLGQTPNQLLFQRIAFSATHPGIALAGTANQGSSESPPLSLEVVGVSKGRQRLPGEAMAIVPNRVATDYWTLIAKANQWGEGEYQSVTLLADSPSNVEGVRARARAAGYVPQPAAGGLDLLFRAQLALYGLGLLALVFMAMSVVTTFFSALDERGRDLAVLKLLGARSSDIRLILVIETVVLGCLGALVGVVAAGLLIKVGNRLLDAVAGVPEGLPASFRLDWNVILGAVIAAAALSALGGLLPALRAERRSLLQILRRSA